MSEGWHITAHDINLWADRNPRRAQEELPLLVAKLILASVKPTNIHIPSKDAILLKGWDGIVEVKAGNPFVTSGLSVWEFGTSKDYKRKANEDYKKRSEDPLEIDKTNATFVIVTSRIWEDKKNWEQEKNAEGKWKQVRVLDAVDLETWLHQCPGVHGWFARRMGKRPEGALDIEQAWGDWRFTTEPPSNENLVIAGRTEALENLIGKLKNEPSVIRVFGESKDEAYAFTLASIIKNAQELTPRVLIISDAREWFSAIESESLLILIPFFDNTMNWRLAVNQGHWVIVPESSPQNKNQDGNLILPRPNKQSLIKALIGMGVDEEKARNMVKTTKGFLTPLRRLLGNFKKPKWAQPENSMPLITALLIGAWNEKNEYDRKKVKKLAGMPYNELEKILHGWSVGDDPPVRKVGSIWQVVSRQDMWQQLAPYISPRTLEKFGQIAVEVLQELDPRYELKTEERWLANIHGNVFKHSETIRKHIAEMLAMLAAYGDEDLRNTGEITIQDIVSLWVRKILLDDTSSHRWYSFRNLLPYLAEASPEVFLEAVEKSLKGNQPPLMKLFVEEGDFGGCPHAGLLWALEGISWNLGYLPQVVFILAKLSRLDPRGRWANRPFNTLKEIFLSWHPQTKASVKERLQHLDLILSKEPEVGWKLLLSLVSKGVGEVATPIHKPYFMDWTEGWKPEVTKKEYWDYVSGISEKIKKYSMGNLEMCLPELIEILEYLPEQVFDSIIKDLKASVDNVSPEKRAETYEKLFEIICKHKKFPDAKWALPEEAIGKLEELLQKFTPDDPVNKNKILFNKWPHDIVCQSDIEYTEKGRITEEKRKSVLKEIWEKQGLDGIIKLIKIAELTHTIGHFLAISSFSDEIEDVVLQWLDSENKKLSNVAQVFIYTKSNQNKNYLQAMFEKYKTEWNPNKWAKFFLALPFTPEVFDFIQNLPHEVEKIYWKNIQYFYLSKGSKEQAEWVIRKLLENNRSIAALNAASQYLHTIAKESGLDANLLAEVLERLAAVPEDSKLEQIDIYGIEQIFDYLQKSSEIDLTHLARLEWAYILYFWYNRFHARIKPVTLIKEVLDNPDLFVQLIRWAFKPKPPIEGEFSDLSSEQKKRLGENAYFLLNMIDELPGQSGEDIDLTKLMEWIKHAQEKCKQVNRLPICDEKIGEILSHSPSGKDGIWPHETVREVIEGISSKDMERGIEIGIYNQRGVVTKSLGEGGKQERKLAERYDQFADALRLKWPRTAAMLKRIAQGYIREASREDLRSELDDLLTNIIPKSESGNIHERGIRRSGMGKMNQKEKLFFDQLKDIFIGAKIEGESGFINLMRIKSAYFDVIFKELNKEIEEETKDFPDFKEEMFDKLYTFFKTYFSESGSIYFNYTPLKSKVYERIYSPNKDVILFWKTHMLYYVKTDRLWNNLTIDFDEDGVRYKINFDVSKLQHKKANEKREIIYELKEIKDREITFNVLYSERGRKTKIDEILRAFRKENIHLDEERLLNLFRTYEKQNEVDYFINKNAEQFLKEQFDLWLKNYLFDDESDFSEKRLKQLKVLKETAYKVIDFVAQFEDELVKIWNKPKFVLNSNYVITLDRIAKKDGGIKLIEKILKHKGFEEQKKEWKDLGILDAFDESKLFINTLNGKELSKEYQFLPIDTKYFDEDIKLELLSLFDDLDKELDGWLIHSENYQALKTILPKFKEKVQTIYIDPPFNKEQDADYFYSVKYKDATWITLLENRLHLARDVLKDTGSIFVRCDYNGNMYVRLLMNEIFEEENFRNEIIINKSVRMKTEGKRFPSWHDSIFWYSRNTEEVYFYHITEEREKEEWRSIDMDGEKWDVIPKDMVSLFSPENIKYDEDGNPTSRARIILSREVLPRNGRRFPLQEVINQWEKEGRIRFSKTGNPQMLKPQQIYLSDDWTGFYGYAFNWDFSTENSEVLLKRVIEATSKEGDIVMDFFLGIGTATAVAHKLKRKWIGIEMGEHFHRFEADKGPSGILVRMKEVLAGKGNHEPSGISKEVNWQGSGFFKYYDLEQYEQTLRKAVYKESHPFVDFDDKSIYQQYVFMKDLKLLDAMKIDYENNRIKINFEEIYPNIDLAETLSNLTGKWIKKIEKNAVIFEDGIKIDFDDIDFNLIKPLIWW